MKEIHIPFANDRVIVKDKGGLYLQSTLSEDVSIWLSDLDHNWLYYKGVGGFLFEFEEDEDAIMFKLTWG